MTFAPQIQHCSLAKPSSGPSEQSSSHGWLPDLFCIYHATNVLGRPRFIQTKPVLNYLVVPFASSNSSSWIFLHMWTDSSLSPTLFLSDKYKCGLGSCAWPKLQLLNNAAHVANPGSLMVTQTRFNNKSQLEWHMIIWVVYFQCLSTRDGNCFLAHLLLPVIIAMLSKIWSI